MFGIGQQGHGHLKSHSDTLTHEMCKISLSARDRLTEFSIEEQTWQLKIR